MAGKHVGSDAYVAALTHPPAFPGSRVNRAWKEGLEGNPAVNPHASGTPESNAYIAGAAALTNHEAASPPYAVTLVDVPGTATLLKDTWTPVLDSSPFTFACWMDADSIAGDFNLYSMGDGVSGGNRTWGGAFNTGTPQMGIRDQAPFWNITAGIADISIDTLYFVMAAQDGTTTSIRAAIWGPASFAETGASAALTTGPDLTTYDAEFWLFDRHDQSRKFNGQVADVWFDTTYYDPLTPADVAKFVDVSGTAPSPKDPGSTGAGWGDGTQPLIFFQTAAQMNAGTNQGSGGDFTKTGAGSFT